MAVARAPQRNAECREWTGIVATGQITVSPTGGICWFCKVKTNAFLAVSGLPGPPVGEAGALQREGEKSFHGASIEWGREASEWTGNQTTRVLARVCVLSIWASIHLRRNYKWTRNWRRRHFWESAGARVMSIWFQRAGRAGPLFFRPWEMMSRQLLLVVCNSPPSRSGHFDSGSNASLYVWLGLRGSRPKVCSYSGMANDFKRSSRAVRTRRYLSLNSVGMESGWSIFASKVLGPTLFLYFGVMPRVWCCALEILSVSCRVCVIPTLEKEKEEGSPCYSRRSRQRQPERVRSRRVLGHARDLC